MDCLKRQKKLLNIYGAELLCYSFRSIEEMEEEDRYNRDTRLTAKHTKAITVKNDVFNPEAFKQWLSGNLDSVGEITRAAYYNTSGV